MSTAHTDVAAVGSVAQAAGVKTLVLTHIAPADPKIVPDDSWQRRAQQGFTGRVVVGHDLERVSLS